MNRLFFQEYEAFAASVQEASMTMRITSFEEPKWTLQYAAAGSLRVQQGYEGGGSIAEGTTFSDGWVFYQQSHPGRTNGQIATQDEVFAAPPGSEFCLVCHPCHDWLTVFVPTALLFPSPPELEFASSTRPQLLKPPPHVTLCFTSLVRRFLAAAESRPQLVESPVAVESFQNELLAAAKELFIRNQPSTGRHFLRWRRQAKSAVELAGRDSNLSLSISDLARTSGVPERTLRTAFQRCFGLSPVEFLRILRLNQARRLLLASCPDQTTVTQIAFGVGFWDLGRFAGAYRELFGELPSATLGKPSRPQAKTAFAASSQDSLRQLKPTK
jgi:AraC family transcriptional regulator, ethanolamine operon transcriptional activator